MVTKSLNPHIAIITHGFVRKIAMMNEIAQTLQQPPFDEIYSAIYNVTYYNSDYGIDFRKEYDINSPIFDLTNDKNLTTNFYNKVNLLIKKYDNNITLDIYAHSMGGLVVRAMMRYLVDGKGV